MPFDEAETLIHNWVDKVGQCVTVTRTKYIYTKGGEPGLIIGFINYPRFTNTPQQITEKVFELAEILLKGYKQMNLTVVLPGMTHMISDLEQIKKYTESKK